MSRGLPVSVHQSTRPRRGFRGLLVAIVAAFTVAAAPVWSTSATAQTPTGSGLLAYGLHSVEPTTGTDLAHPFGLDLMVDGVDQPRITGVGRVQIDRGEADFFPTVDGLIGHPTVHVISEGAPSFYSAVQRFELLTVTFSSDPLDCQVHCEVALVDWTPGLPGFQADERLPDFLVGASSFSAIFRSGGELATSYGTPGGAGEVLNFGFPLLAVHVSAEGQYALVFLLPDSRATSVAVSGLAEASLDAAWVTMLEEPLTPVPPGGDSPFEDIEAFADTPEGVGILEALLPDLAADLSGSDDADADEGPDADSAQRTDDATGAGSDENTGGERDETQEADAEVAAETEGEQAPQDGAPVVEAETTQRAPADGDSNQQEESGDDGSSFPAAAAGLGGFAVVVGAGGAAIGLKRKRKNAATPVGVAATPSDRTPPPAGPAPQPGTATDDDREHRLAMEWADEYRGQLDEWLEQTPVDETIADGEEVAGFVVGHQMDLALRTRSYADGFSALQAALGELEAQRGADAVRIEYAQTADLALALAQLGLLATKVPVVIRAATRVADDAAESTRAVADDYIGDPYDAELAGHADLAATTPEATRAARAVERSGQVGEGYDGRPLYYAEAVEEITDAATGARAIENAVNDSGPAVVVSVAPEQLPLLAKFVAAAAKDANNMSLLAVVRLNPGSPPTAGLPAGRVSFAITTLKKAKQLVTRGHGTVTARAVDGALGHENVVSRVISQGLGLGTQASDVGDRIHDLSEWSDGATAGSSLLFGAGTDGAEPQGHLYRWVETPVQIQDERLSDEDLTLIRDVLANAVAAVGGRAELDAPLFFALGDLVTREPEIFDWLADVTVVSDGFVSHPVTPNAVGWLSAVHNSGGDPERLRAILGPVWIANTIRALNPMLDHVDTDATLSVGLEETVRSTIGGGFERAFVLPFVGEVFAENSGGAVGANALLGLLISPVETSSRWHNMNIEAPLLMEALTANKDTMAQMRTDVGDVLILLTDLQRNLSGDAVASYRSNAEQVAGLADSYQNLLDEAPAEWVAEHGPAIEETIEELRAVADPALRDVAALEDLNAKLPTLISELEARTPMAEGELAATDADNGDLDLRTLETPTLVAIARVNAELVAGLAGTTMPPPPNAVVRQELRAETR